MNKEGEKAKDEDEISLSQLNFVNSPSPFFRYQSKNQKIKLIFQGFPDCTFLSPSTRLNSFSLPPFAYKALILFPIQC